MQQKIFLIGEIYLFCIYFSLNNFNYPNKKLAIPSKLRNSSAEFPQHSCEKKTLFGFGGGSPNSFPNIRHQTFGVTSNDYFVRSSDITVVGSLISVNHSSKQSCLFSIARNVFAENDNGKNSLMVG